MSIRYTLGISLLGCLLALAFGFVPSSHAAPVTIDDFVDSQGHTFHATGAAPEYAGSMIGGARDVSAEVFSNADSSHLGVGVAEIVGAMTVSVDTLVASDVSFTWDGAGPSGLGGFDLTDGGTNHSIYVVVLANDIKVDLVFALVDSGGKTAMGVIPVPSVQSSTTFSAAFASFSTAPGFDWTMIDSIEVKLTAMPYPISTFDIAFDALGATAPEPSSLVLLSLGVGGLGLLTYRRRRQKKNARR